MCQTWASRSRIGTRVSLPSSSNRQSSTPSATSENRVKFVPAPSYVAPRGYGPPGHASIVLLRSCLGRRDVRGGPEVQGYGERRGTTSRAVEARPDRRRQAARLLRRDDVLEMHRSAVRAGQGDPPVGVLV